MSAPVFLCHVPGVQYIDIEFRHIVDMDKTASGAHEAVVEQEKLPFAGFV
jgi:hypothetical protein